MNRVDRKALKWLEKQGLAKDLYYRKTRSPRFILADGTMSEAKRIVGKARAIYFGGYQFEELKKFEDRLTILAFTDDSDEPVLLPMKKLEPNKIIKGIYIAVGKTPNTLTATIDENVLKEFRLIVASRYAGRIDACVEDALRLWLKRELTPKKEVEIK